MQVFLTYNVNKGLPLSEPILSSWFEVTPLRNHSISETQAESWQSISQGVNTASPWEQLLCTRLRWDLWTGTFSICICVCSHTSYESSWAPLNAKIQPKEEGVCVMEHCSKCCFLGEKQPDIYKGGHCCGSYCYVTYQLLKLAVERSALCTLLWKFSTITLSQIHRPSAAEKMAVTLAPPI